MRRPRTLGPGCLLALAMLMPGAAYPISMTQLLRLPLEELLRLEVSSPAPAPRSRAVAPCGLARSSVWCAT
jgi:hypothetical protein